MDNCLLSVLQEQESFQIEIQKAQTKLLQLSRDKRYEKFSVVVRFTS